MPFYKWRALKISCSVPLRFNATSQGSSFHLTTKVRKVHKKCILLRKVLNLNVF